MTEAKDIDSINNIMEMVGTMAALGVSCEGCQTLDEMKNRVKETLKTSEKKWNWTAKEAFSVLTEAKEEDERKRATLNQFYEDTEACLNSMDDKIRNFLEQEIGNLHEIMAINKRNLKKKNYIVLVTGETSSGKSTLLNLILGEQLLPYSTLSTTSTICELKYGSKPKLVAHLKKKDPQTGLTEMTVWLGQSKETSQQSYFQEISSFVHVKTNREEGSDYKKIELFWPHSLLKQGIVIVDSPGIGEDDIMDDMVNEYFPEAFAFIYVINSTNAGGIQKDRVVKLIEHASNISREQRSELSTRALFVCNKWDLVPPGEAGDVKNYIIKNLTKYWPSLDPDSQVISISSTNAMKAQGYGIITKEFATLMTGIKSMVLKSIEARLQTQWRWLDYLLSRMVFQTKAFIHNSHGDRSKVIERMTFITERLNKMEERQSLVEKELQEYLENKTVNVVSALSKYLKSTDVLEQFTLWTLDDVPKASLNFQLELSTGLLMMAHRPPETETLFDYSYIKNWWVQAIEKALIKRLQDVIAAWEYEHHVLADARASLIQYLQERLNFVEGQLRNLEICVLARPHTEIISVADIIGVPSLPWFAGLFLGAIGGRGLVTLAITLSAWSKTREYEKDKRGFMAKVSKEYLTKAAEEQNLRSYVLEQLNECQVCLKQVVARIPKLIEADKMLCQQLRDEERSQKEIEDFYTPLCQKSLKLSQRVVLFGIKEVRTMEISCNDLEWNDDASSLLGTGAFAFVYRGTLKQRKGGHPVALKVWKDELNVSNASVFLAEIENLRKLDYPFIVKFYGAALLKEGDQVRGIIVMELCKDNLMRHIFKNPENIPAMPSSTPPTARNTIRWAKDIAYALEVLHGQFVHRDLKLENILISNEDVVKIADVGVCKETKMITGTMTGTPAYVAPEVVKSSMYDSKADIYSFGIMMWEMWYGRRALLEVGGDLNTFYGKVVEGVRPSHVEDRRMPPDGWQRLMQLCWDNEADKRPTAAMCFEELTKLYQEAIPPI